TIVDGWLRSGDIGRVDEEGFIYVEDRAKDMILRGGENVYCAEVEAAIYEHPSVHEAAVFGVPHERLGEEVAAVVVPVAGATLTARCSSASCGRASSPRPTPPADGRAGRRVRRAAAQSGGSGAGMRARGESTVPKRSWPAFQSRAAWTSSSRLRPTKFHAMRTGSANGCPPSSSARAGAAAASTSSSRPVPR